MKNEKYLYLIILIILQNFSAKCQIIPTYTWQKPDSNSIVNWKFDNDKFYTIGSSLKKWDTSGNIIWNSTLFSGKKVLNDGNGNLVLLSTMTSPSVNFGNTTLVNNGGNDILLIKLDSNGNFLNAQNFGGVGNDSIDDFCIDINNDIYLYGIYNGQKSALKVLNNFQLSWIKIINDNMPNFSSNLVFPKIIEYSSYDSTIVICYVFIDTLTVDSNMVYSNNWAGTVYNDVFLLKIGMNGDVQFLKTFGLGKGESQNFMHVSSNGDIFLSYCYNSYMQANGNIIRLDKLGNIIYTITPACGPYANNCEINFLTTNDSLLIVSQSNKSCLSVYNKASGVLELNYNIMANNCYIDELNNIYIHQLAGYPEHIAKFGSPLMVINNYDTISICQGSLFTPNYVMNLGQPPYTINWSPNIGINSNNIMNPTFQIDSEMVYTVSVYDNAGNFFLDTLTFISNANSSSMNSASVCSNQLPYVWNGQNLTSSGVYSDTLLNSKGCDSIATLNLTVNPSLTLTDTISICSNQLPFFWHGQNILTSGIYNDTSINVLGCDTISTLLLTVNPISFSFDTLTVCSNQVPYVWNGQNLSQSGLYQDTLINSVGCDSIASLLFTVNPISFSFDTLTVCSNQVPYVWNGQSLSQSGIYQDTLINSAGCDSIATLQLLINPSPQPSILLTNSLLICTNSANVNYQWYFNNLPIGINADTVTITQNGLYWVMTTDTLGCIGLDSIQVITLESGSILQTVHELKLYPNPTSTSIFIGYFLLQDSKMSFQILDVVGNVITKTKEEKQVKGQHTIEINLQTFHLSRGMYLLQLSDGITHWNLTFVYRP